LSDDEHSGIFRSRFGRNWRSWAWFRDQWTNLSLSIVGGLCAILIGIGGWAVSLKTRVVVLETEVTPILRETKVESNNAIQIIDLDRRVTRLENNLDLDLNEKLRAEREAEAKDGKK